MQSSLLGFWDMETEDARIICALGVLGLQKI
jgi:hypothetical protein